MRLLSSDGGLSANSACEYVESISLETELRYMAFRVQQDVGTVLANVITVVYPITSLARQSLQQSWQRNPQLLKTQLCLLAAADSCSFRLLNHYRLMRFQPTTSQDSVISPQIGKRAGASEA